MNKLFSFFFNKNKIPQESQPKSRLLEGWNAYQEARKLLLIKDIKLRKDEEALALFDKAIECGIEDAYGERAFILQALGYYYDSILDFDKAISKFKDDANFYFGRGHSKKIVGDYDGCISDLRKAVELSQLDTKLNTEYNDEMRKSGWSSAAQYFRFQLQDSIDAKESSQKEHLKEFYEKMIKEIKRRDISE